VAGGGVRFSDFHALELSYFKCFTPIKIKFKKETLVNLFSEMVSPKLKHHKQTAWEHKHLNYVSATHIQ